MELFKKGSSQALDTFSSAFLCENITKNQHKWYSRMCSFEQNFNFWSLQSEPVGHQNTTSVFGIAFLFSKVTCPTDRSVPQKSYRL